MKIVVCGATSAIAMHAEREWARLGASFFLIGRDLEKLGILRQDLEVRGAKQVEVRMSELADADSHKALLDEAWTVLGGVDLFMVAHGVLGDQRQCETDFQAARELLWINFVSIVSLLHEAADRLEQSKKGHIVVISSVAGDRGRKSNYVYGSAKAGLSTFVAGLRNRLSKSGVHVLTVKPGFVDTPMTAHLKKGPLFASAEIVGKGIVRAVEKRADVVYLPWFWRWIMVGIRSIPEPVFKRTSI